MAALFGHGNPLSTQVGQLIEQATDGTNATENWALYMEVCDVINETDEGPKDAIRAFRKRISQNVGKNYTAVMYCLTCLESSVKNCGRRFHLQVANKDFLHDLVKIMGPKNDPPQVIQEKVLSMIQTWADAFRGNPELKEMEKVYQELKQKGIEFPMTDLDNMAPIHTPARSVPEKEQQALSHDRGGSSRGKKYAELVNESDDEHPPPTFPPAQTTPYPMIPPQPTMGVETDGGPLAADQISKLRRELEVVQGNVRIMGEMLTELSPTSVDSSDLELLQELNRTCRQMQSRLVELLNETATEEVTDDLLRVNDDLNNVFLRYERFERYRTGQSGQATTPVSESVPPNDSLPPAYDQLPAASNPKVGNLIDLSDDPVPNDNSINSQLAGLTMGGNSVSSTLGSINSTTATNAAPPPARGDDDFDMFAQSRQSFDQSRQAVSQSNTYNNQHPDTLSGGLGQAVSARTNQDTEDKPFLSADPEDLSMSDEETLKLQEKETDYDEMEQWLATHEGQQQGSDAKTQEPITSSDEDDGSLSTEFDRFLSERATASDTLPSISAQTGRSSRTLQKKDEDENPLFAL